MPETPRPYPLPDRDTAPFWEAQNRHRLTFQRCSGCAFVRYPVGPLCPECRSFGFEWITSTGRGVVHSFTVVQHQTPGPGFQGFGLTFTGTGCSEFVISKGS